MKAPLLMSHGFSVGSVTPEHSFRIYEQAQKQGIPAQIYYHQNRHGRPPPLNMMNRCFSHSLHGIDNGVEHDAKAWIVRENDATDSTTSYKDYPNPETSEVILYPRKGGLETGTLITEKPKNQGKETLVDDYHFSGDDLAQAESSNN